MVTGLEEKKLSYVLSNKNIDSVKLAQLSSLTSAHEKYGEVIKKLISKLKEDVNLITSSEIEMRNIKEKKVADLLLDVKTRLVRSESHLRNSVNELI